MSESPIVGAAPRTRTLGIKDSSGRPPVYSPMDFPHHFPVSFIYAAKGPVGVGIPVVGDTRNRTFGAATFDPNERFYNHATKYANIFNENANTTMIERVVPEDAPPPANCRMYIDMLPVKKQVYQRNPDGSFKLDSDGNRIPVVGQTIDGFSVKFVPVHIEPGADGEDQFGLGTILPGDQTDPATSTQSERYPLYDIEVSSQGYWGNNVGHRVWADTQESTMPVKQYLIDKYGVYPFRVAAIEREDLGASPSIIETQVGEQYVDLVLKPGFYDKDMNRRIGFEEGFESAWRDLEPADGTPPIYGPFGRIKVYDANIELLLQKFYRAEFPAAVPGMTDFDGSADDYWKFNLFGGRSSFNAPYASYEILASKDGGVRPTSNTNIYCVGGGDGDMSLENFDVAVGKRLSLYSDPNSEYTNHAIHPETIFYDSGFGQATKEKAMSILSLRKDLSVVISTLIAGEPQLTAAEDSSRAARLISMIRAYPESFYYGTSVCRALLCMRSGISTDRADRMETSLSYVIADLFSKYMGASSGIWNRAKRPDEFPANVVTQLKSMNARFTSDKVRNQDWANGAIWSEAVDYRQNFIPAIRTVYKDDTSILTGALNMLGAVALQRIGLQALARVSGNQNLTQTLLAKRVQDFVIESVTGRFDDRFIIEPVVFFTAADTQAGYRWSLNIRMGGNGMPTVQTLTVETLRASDMTA